MKTQNSKVKKVLKAVAARWKWIVGVLALVALVLAARTLPVGEWLDRVTGPLRELGWWGVALYALVYFVAAMLCIPCMPLTLASGVIFGTWHGVAAVHTGCVLASAGGFLMGRAVGRKRAAEWLRKSERFHFLDEAVAKEGWKIVGLLRMHAIPFGASNYLYGMTAVDFWHYLLATAVSMLPGHFIYVHLGTVGGRHLEGKGELGALELVGPVLGIASMVALTVVFKRIVQRHGGLGRTLK